MSSSENKKIKYNVRERRRHDRQKLFKAINDGDVVEIENRIKRLKNKSGEINEEIQKERKYEFTKIKDKFGNTILMAVIKIAGESNCF